jgi:hypothetical protein
MFAGVASGNFSSKAAAKPAIDGAANEVPTNESLLPSISISSEGASISGFKVKESGLGPAEDIAKGTLSKNVSSNPTEVSIDSERGSPLLNITLFYPYTALSASIARINEVFNEKTAKEV